MINQAYRKRLNRLFQGEVFGEALYLTVVRCTWRPERQHKWDTLRKLETQTKIQLQSVIFQKGWDADERARYKFLGITIGMFAAILPWRLSLKFIKLIVCTGLKNLDRFVTRAPLDEKMFAKSVWDHECAQYEFVQRELRGDGKSSLEHVLVLLKS
ncbi:MAG: hypothetical protein GY941_30670 [Planctomycetes bacterium]|nr:hypothetical protein [Planctomycetota bacterium]